MNKSTSVRISAEDQEALNEAGLSASAVIRRFAEEWRQGQKETQVIQTHLPVIRESVRDALREALPEAFLRAYRALNAPSSSGGSVPRKSTTRPLPPET